MATSFRISSRKLVAASAGILFSYIAVVVAFNIWLPAGIHLVIAANAVRETDKKPDFAHFNSLLDILAYRLVSKSIISMKPSCDTPYFEDGNKRSGRSARLGLLIYFYKSTVETDNDWIIQLLKEKL